MHREDSRHEAADLHFERAAFDGKRGRGRMRREIRGHQHAVDVQPIRQMWTATTTTDRDRKELLRTLLEEVILNLNGYPCSQVQADGTAHRRGYDLAASRLAALYPDEVIAGIGLDRGWVLPHIG